jgi:hypothetical protein
MLRRRSTQEHRAQQLLSDLGSPYETFGFSGASAIKGSVMAGDSAVADYYGDVIDGGKR